MVPRSLKNNTEPKINKVWGGRANLYIKFRKSLWVVTLKLKYKYKYVVIELGSRENDFTTIVCVCGVCVYVCVIIDLIIWS